MPPRHHRRRIRVQLRKMADKGGTPYSSPDNELPNVKAVGERCYIMLPNKAIKNPKPLLDLPERLGNG